MATKMISIHMNTGDGETSYANNSSLQKAVISKTWSILDDTLKDMFIDNHNNGIFLPKCFKMVDLGCSSGPNSILVISHIMDTIEELCRLNKINNKLPEFEVFLNDLPHNDFNNLFKLLPAEETKRRRQCFINGTPGSFYERLFPSNSLHFAYSSCTLHWLSRVPEGLEKNNKANIHMAMTSPPEVNEAYAEQYRKDFSQFLSSRGQEIVPGGRMVLVLIGRSIGHPSSKDEDAVLSLLADTLNDMVAEGLIKEDDLFSFNLPIYTPCQEEVEEVITNEGSFNLDKMEVYRDANENEDDPEFDEYRTGKFVADYVRATLESILESHFGSFIMDDVFERYEKKVAEYLFTQRLSKFTIAISLRRK